MRDSVLAILGLVIFAARVFAGAAWAADASAPPSGAVASTPNGGLMMSSQVCTSLGAPPAGVPGADYQPGVDVNGNAVAPADLPSSNANPSVDNFPIEINQRLAHRFNLPLGGNAKAVLGYVTVRNNQAYFNGQPLDADQTAALAEACAASGIKVNGH
ncbi:MAG TPA: hypothetical protein VG328_27130 [Stellaceae bacterium]|jgi:hypothetical protein|nr:hypothetical protein [Stellaceae bacterium]